MSTSSLPKRSYGFCALSVVAMVAVAMLVFAPAQPPSPNHARSQSLQPAAAAHERVKAALAALPLAFEQNEGQVDAQVRYMARGSGYRLFLTANDAVLSFASSAPARVSRPKQLMEQRLLGYSRKTHRLVRPYAPANSVASRASVASLRMHLLNSNPEARAEGRDLLSGRTNYFIGNDPHKWHVGVQEYGRVAYSDVYPGVDLVYHGQEKQLEFDFIVAPHAQPDNIAMSFVGARIATNEAGELALNTPAGEITLHRPIAYQVSERGREIVDSRFVLEAKNQVRFALGSYDHNRELVIDPSLDYATYIGGNGDDEAYGIAIDSSGNFYITGESDSTSGFPGSNPPFSGPDGVYESFVVQITSNGSLGYTTFVGGSTGDALGSAIAVTSSATPSVYVAGITTATDLPTTPGVVQPDSGSPAGSNCTTSQTTTTPCTDGFVFQLNSSGAPTYVTYLGGSNDDGAFGIAIDASGNAYVTGFTFSSDFPTKNPIASTLNNNVPSSPPYEDAFVSEINPAGTAFVYSTYLGGMNNDFGSGIAVDKNNAAYVAGSTYSSDFPVSTGAYQTGCGTNGYCNAGSGLIFSDAFVTKIAASGTALSYSTYLGGSSDDFGMALNLDAAANIYITGETTDDNPHVTTGDFPVVGGFETKYGNGNASAGSNAFISEITPAGHGASDLLYSSYLGGSTADAGLGLAVDATGNAFVTGSTLSSDFPTANAFQTSLNGNSDAFVSYVVPGGSSLGYSSYLGGSGDEDYDSSSSAFLGGAAYVSITAPETAEVFLTGATSSPSTTSSTQFPVTASALQTTYGGDPFDAFAATVTGTLVPGFLISGPGTTTPPTVSAGNSATAAITLTAVNGYNSAVNLTCTVTGSGSPLPACGSFSPASPLTPTTGGAQTTLTITTTGSSAAVVHPSKVFYAMFLPVIGLAFMAMSFSSAPSRRKKFLGFLMVGTVMVALFMLPACGGGSGSSNNGGGGQTGGCTSCTPAGTYTVTVTATGTDTASTTHSTSVTLKVN